LGNNWLLVKGGLQVVCFNAGSEYIHVF
jgi:hypothetical protein